MSLAGVLPGLPARAYMAASMGEDALVPPTSFHPPSPLDVSYTATPVAGSASAATSLSIRLEQPAGRLSAACQDGFGSTVEQPDPVPSEPGEVFHTDSVQPREFEAVLRLVPPTETTFGEAAG